MCTSPNIIYKLWLKSDKTRFHKFDCDFINDLKKKNIKYQLVPCGQCLQCKYSIAKQWSIRLAKEFETSKSCIFLTLTYNNDYLIKERNFKNDIRKFFHDLRNYLNMIYKVKIRYYCTFEYGEESLRPHFHAIIYDFPYDFLTPVNAVDYSCSIIDRYWIYGFNTIQKEPNIKQLRYVAGYVQKKLKTDISFYKENNLVLPFMVCSKGLGSKWLKDNLKDINTNELITYKDDKPQFNSFPRYFVKKTEEFKPNLFNQLKEESALSSERYAKCLSRLPYNEQLKFFRNRKLKVDKTKNLMLRNKI